VWLFSTNLHEALRTGADKFTTLCHAQADISTAQYKTCQGNADRTYYKRDYDLILLVGLTELKAQFSWIDSVTVSSQEIISHSPILTSVIYGV
jgi:hypothetical protein